MNFYFGLIAWLIIAAVLITGVVLVATFHSVGSFIVLGAGMAIFVAGFIKFGCLTH